MYKDFYLEHKQGDDYVEYEYRVAITGYSPYRPARISGPPENCYPAEGGEVSYDSETIKRRRTKPADLPWETVPYSVFLEGIVESEGFKDDPAGKWCGKTALDKAEEYINYELYQEVEEEMEARYDAGEHWRDD